MCTQSRVLFQVLLLALIVSVPLNGWRMAKRTAWFLLSIYVAFQVCSATATLYTPPHADRAAPCAHHHILTCDVVQVLFLMSEERLIFRTPFNQSAVQKVH